MNTVELGTKIGRNNPSGTKRGKLVEEALSIYPHLPDAYDTKAEADKLAEEKIIAEATAKVIFPETA